MTEMSRSHFYENIDKILKKMVDDNVDVSKKSYKRLKKDV